MNIYLVLLVICIILISYFFNLAFHETDYLFFGSFIFINLSLIINILGVYQGKTSTFFTTFSGASLTIGIVLILLFIQNKKIELRSRFKHLNNISYHDRLTGLYNRRFLLEKVEKLKPTDYPAAVVFIDIDNLKQINDNLGHLVGDQAIIKTAQILKNLTRENDIVARVGGDEFIVFLYNTAENEAEIFCSRIEGNCSKANSNTEFIFSCSSGFTIIDSKNNNLDEAINIADREMYSSKNKKKGMI
jgi:diguanylate cyclase (GGDEF)-like protein